MESVKIHTVKRMENAIMWKMEATLKYAMENAGRKARNATENVDTINAKQKVDHVKSSLTLGFGLITVYAMVNVPSLRKLMKQNLAMETVPIFQDSNTS